MHDIDPPPTPPSALPGTVDPREVGLAWLAEGLVPLASSAVFQRRNSLKEAVAEARAGYEEKLKVKCIPWVRAGTGMGSAVFNIQGILLLEAASQGK